MPFLADADAVHAHARQQDRSERHQSAHGQTGRLPGGGSQGDAVSKHAFCTEMSSAWSTGIRSAISATLCSMTCCNLADKFDVCPYAAEAMGC